MTDRVIDVQNVSKAFESPTGRIQALEHMTFTVGSGELISIVGASGCGKSTLLRIMAGLLPPSSGSVILDGEKMDTTRPETVGVVFQHDALLPWFNLETNVGLGLAARRVPAAERAQKVAAALQTVGLSGFERALPHALSGGMRQRGALARALVLEPRVLLLDEPFASLDEQTRNLMGEELRELHGKVGGAMVMVTHSLTEAVLLSDRVIAMSSSPGRLQREMVIDLPAERSVELIDTPEFAELRHRLWKELEENWTQAWSADGRSRSTSQE